MGLNTNRSINTDTLTGLSNVNVISPSSGDSLVYNGTTWGASTLTITGLESDIQANSGRIDVLEVDYSGLSGYVVLNSGRIDDNSVILLANSGRIDVLEFDYSGLSGDVIANSGRIDTNESNITVNSGRVDTNETDISVNSGRIDDNESNITVNSGRVDTNESNITSNSGRVDTLKNHSYVTVTLDYDFESNIDIAFANASGGNVTVGLPSGVSGILPKKIKKIDSTDNYVIVSGVSSQQVDGDTTATLVFENDSITCAFDGSDWFII